MNEYLLKLYDWIGTKDSTFKTRISSEDFVSKMENDSDYGSKMYDWISTKDKSFEARLDRKEFYNKTFKKKSPFKDIYEESQDDSNSTEVQEGMESNTQQTEQNGSSDYSAITKNLEDRYDPNIEKPTEGEKPTIENAPDWMKDPNLFAARQAGTVTDKDYRESGLEKGPVSTLGGSPTRQEQVEAFSRIQDQKVKTDEELDFIAKQKGLGTDFAYEKFSSGDTFVKDNFDSEYLSKMNVNLSDFDGYLEKEGLKKDYLDREGRGFYDYKEEGLKHDEVLAKETDKLLMLNNYIKLQKERDIDWQKLQDQRKTGVDPNNTEFKDSYKPSAFNVNSTMLGNYIQKEMPQLTKKLKERDAKTKELYDQYKNGGISWATFISTASKSGWNGLVGRIEELSASALGAATFTGIDYFQNRADISRSKISQKELLEDDNLSYTFASGQQVKVDGVNYLVTKDNRLYDVDKKIDVTNVIDEKNYNKILKKSVTEGVTNSTFSGRGMTYETANVVGDMVVQIAGTKGFGSAMTKASTFANTVSKGTGLLSKGRNLLGKGVGYIGKIPIDRSMASSIMAQSTMGLSSGYESTLKAAKEAGINDEEARKLALIAGKETAALYALTAPISTQTKATEAIFGKIKKNTLEDIVSIYLKNGEAAVYRKFKESGKKVLDLLGEGAKEGVQENIQQAGEVLVVGDRTNKRAGQDIVKSEISYDDFINTTTLSFTAGMLMPGAGSAAQSLNKKRRSLLGFDGIDRLKSLEELANNEDKVKSMLTSQEGKGIYTSKEVNDLMSEIKLFKTTVGKVPGSVNPKAMMEVMEDVDNISKLELKKKSLDPAFHEDIDKEISDSRQRIKTTIDAYKNLDTAIETALKKEEVAKEEVAKEEVAKEEVAKEEVAKERYKDSQIPKSRTDFTVTDADGTTTTIEVTTRLDGSRRFTYKSEDGVYQTESVSKDNTLSSEAYIALGIDGEITDSSNVSIDKVMNPKMAERMSDRQREAVGIKPVVKEEVSDKVEELSMPKAIKSRGVDMVKSLKSAIKAGISKKLSPKQILKTIEPTIAFTPQEIQEISKYIDQEISRPGEKKLAEKTKIEEEVKALADFFGKKVDLKTKVENSKKALSKLSPDVKVILHESEQEYNKVAQEGTAGEFNPSTNTIHINPAKANGRTVAHEAFHALIVNALKTDEKARVVTEKMLKAISKSVSNELQLELDSFLKGYKENIQSEESLAEIVGKLADEYSTLDAKAQNLISRWLQKLAKMLGLAKFTDADVVDMLNVISRKIESGEVISEEDVNIIEDIQGGSGLVGKVGDIASKRSSIPAPSIKTDTRSFAKLVKDRDLVDFRGMNFITNMYDYTTAGVVEFANNLKLNLFGGKNYVPYMMDKKGLSLGDMSNLAAFNTEAQANSFIRNVRKGNAKLFIPHSGSLSGSWQFQHAIFEQMMDLIIDNEVLTNKEIIKMFNQAVDNTNLYNQFKQRTKEFNKKGYWVKVTEPTKKNKLKKTKKEKIYTAPDTQQVIREDLVKFNKNTGQELLKLDKYLSDPKELVRLLDAETNSSPDLRKRLSDKLTANKKVQKKLGIKRKADFWDKIIDPMNKGVKGGELMGIVEFDNTNFKVVKTKLGDIDHHPSFGWTVLAKIEGIYQPTNFHKTWDVTDEYVKYNKEETVVSRKSDVSMKQYKDSNVSSSAGSIPKQGTVTNVPTNKKPSKRSQKVVEKTPEAAYKAIGYTQSQVDSWKKENSNPKKMPHPKAAIEAAKNLIKGTISTEEARSIIDESMPSKMYTELPEIPTIEEVVLALTTNKLKKKGVVGLNVEIPDGSLIESRLDIPAYMSYGIYVETYHNGSTTEFMGAKKRGVIGYGQTAVLNNVSFDTNGKLALRVASGGAKSPFAVMSGEYKNEAVESAKKRAKEALTSDDWVQVGMNPYKQSKFFDRSNNKPVDSAEEVIQIGPLVLAKGVKYGEASEITNKETGATIRFQRTLDPLLEVRSSKPTIQDLISKAKSLGFSDEGITAYLKSIGHVPTADEIQTLGKEALMDKAKKITWKKTKRKFREKIFDRQTRVKDTLKGLDSKEGERAKTMLVNKAGASGYANKRFKEAEEAIFKKKVAGVSVDLSADETRQLNNIIYSERIISINKSREAKGEDKYVGRLGFDSEAAQESLDKIKSEVGEKKFEDLTNRAKIYFTTLKKSLERGYKAGLISEKVYNELKDINYSPIRTIKYLLPDSDLYESEIDNLMMQTGTKYEFISNLSDSNNSDIVTDAKWLLMSNISMTESRVSSNRVLSSFDKAIKEATPEQKAEISEYIKENPVIGTKSNGDLKFKYDKKMPAGFTSLSYKENGQLRKIIVAKKYAEILLDQKKSSKILSGAGVVSLGGVLRFFATAGNPLFIVGNTAIDFTNVLFLSNVYSEFKLLGGAELGLDFFKNFAKKVSNTKNYKEIYDEFVEHGGSMDYLSTDGVSKLARIKYKNNRTSEIGAKALVGIGRFMGYLGESSEISMRLAVYEKSKSNQLKQFKKENNREPNELELEEIKFRSARESRETIDFSQGGSIVKELDKVMPYLNAATQGTRKFIDYASQNPKGFASSIVQAGIYSAGFMAMSMMNLFRGVDDEDDKKSILDTINSLSVYERSNYHIMFTGTKDKDGEFEYYRVKKLPLLSVATSAAEEFVINTMLKQKGIDRDFDFNVTGKTIEGGLPFVPTVPNLVNRIPMASAILSYQNNKDYFYDTDIFKGPIGEISPEAEGLYDEKVANIYKDISAQLGTSPIRLQASFEKIITSPNTNPVVGLAYSGYDAILGSYKGEGASEDVSKALDNLMDNVGRKVKRKTNKNTLVYRDKEVLEEKIIEIKTKTYKKEQEMYSLIKEKLDSGEVYTKKEYVDIIKEKFDPIDRKRYYKKYLTYMRNRNVDKTILNIVYEQNPEAQAYMIESKFGNSFDEEELKEIRLVFAAAKRKFSEKALYIYRRNISKK